MPLESVLLKWRVFLDWAACCTRMRPTATCVAAWRGLCVGELCSGWIVKKAGMVRTRVGRSKHALDGVPDPCIASGTKGDMSACYQPPDVCFVCLGDAAICQITLGDCDCCVIKGGTL